MKGTTNHSEGYENLTFCSLKNYFDFDHSSFYIGYQSATTEICNINCIKPIYIVKCVISGKGYLEITGKKYHIKQNDIFLLPKNVRVTYVADKDPEHARAQRGKPRQKIQRSGNTRAVRKDLQSAEKLFRVRQLGSALLLLQAALFDVQER